MNDKESLHPLKDVKSDRDYFGDMLYALELGSVADLKYAVSHLSIIEINRSFTHSADIEFSIPAATLPLAVQKDLSTKDVISIGALHFAAKMGDKLCLEVLLEGGADPNMKDSFGQTPLHVLPKSGWKNSDRDFAGCLDILLANERTDWNRLDLSMSTPLLRAEEFQWIYMIERLNSNIFGTSFTSLERNPSDTLMKHLLEDNLEDFKSTLISANTSVTDLGTIINESHGSYTLLQYGCRLGYSNFVFELLKYKASPTCKHQINILSPVMWATKYGYHQILSQLIKSMTVAEMQNGALKNVSEQMETPLHYVVKCENSQSKADCNYHKCLQILLDKEDHIDKNARDADGNTALHYAALCNDLSALSVLLKHGANSTITNFVGLTPLHYVSKEKMMAVLNNCVDFDKNKKLLDKEFWISLNYQMMNIQLENIAVTDCPVSNGSNIATEMNFLNILTETHRDKDILHHPILDIFIYLKWQNIRKCFYLNFGAHIIFLLLLISYICIYHSSLPIPETTSQTNDRSQPTYLRIVFGMILMCTLLTRESIQLFMMATWKDYLFDVKNIIEVVTALISIILLFVPLSDDVKMGMAAWVILFSVLEFILHLGRLPAFSVYISMFNAVAWNFFKFICLFSMIILAFSFSFFLMFQVSETFRTFPEALLKTIVMTTGEVEYSDLPVSSFPVASHILMVLFVFLILLVLVNLLNGLAISDIQAIQKQAELISCMSLIDRMAQCERAFYCKKKHNPLKKVFDWFYDNTLTFRTCLPGHKLIIFINNQEIKYSNDYGTGDLSICKCHSYKLKKVQIETLKSIVLERKQGQSPR